MSLPLNHRRILTNETKVYTICQKSFKKQYEFLMNNLEDLYENYVYNVELCYNELLNANVDLYRNKKSREYIEWQWEQLEWFWAEMWVYDLIEDIEPQLEKTVMKWYKKRYRLFETALLWNWFTYYPDTWSNYAKLWWELNLSNYKWAISYTTKRKVIEIIKNWYDNNLWVWEVAKQINEISDKLFGKARARTIATTEIWKAYEYWSYQPVKQLQSVWVPMKKKWQTVDDDRVRPAHMECELEWRVDLDYMYPAVWQLICPEWVNCRCTMEYKVDN